MKQLFFVTSVNIFLKPVADYSEMQQWLVYIPERLTLEEEIVIAQNKDATASQVGCVQPEFRGNLTQAAVHQLHEKQGSRKRPQVMIAYY